MENLTRTDTEASGRMRWAHTDRTSLRGSRDPRSRDRVRPSHKTRSHSETQG